MDDGPLWLVLNQLSVTWRVKCTHRCKICRLLWQAEKRFLDDLYRELTKFTAISKRKNICHKGTIFIKTLAEICKRVSHILSYPHLKNRLPYSSLHYCFCLQQSSGRLNSLDRKFSWFTQISLHELKLHKIPDFRNKDYLQFFQVWKTSKRILRIFRNFQKRWEQLVVDLEMSKSKQAGLCKLCKNGLTFQTAGRGLSRKRCSATALELGVYKVSQNERKTLESESGLGTECIQGYL